MSRLALALMPLALAGCARFEPIALAPDARAREFQARTLADPGLKAFIERHTGQLIEQWPRKDWNLDDLTLAAFYFQPSLDVARAQWKIAEADIQLAEARPNPTLSITPEGVTRSTGAAPWLFGVTLDWPIETAGKRRHRIAKAVEGSAIAKAKIAESAWQVRNEVTTSALEYAAAESKLELLLRELQIERAIVSSLESQLKAGAVTPFEVTTARMNLQRLELDRGASEIQLNTGRNRIAEAIGIPVRGLEGTKIIFRIADLRSEQVEAENLVAAALQNRPEIAAGLAEYAASEENLQLEIAKQYPDFHLGPGYQFDQGQNKWSLGAGVELPVLNRNKGGIEDAKAKREEAATRFGAAQAKAIGEVERAVSSFSAAREQLRRVELLRSSASQQLRILEGQNRAGEISKFELLTSRMELFLVEAGRLEALVKAQQASKELEFATKNPIWKFDLVSDTHGAQAMKKQ